jgi:hypothetical protein
MMHFGRKEYYRSLQGHFWHADLILHEGKRGTERSGKLPERFGWIMRRRSVYVRLLGASWQHDQIRPLKDSRWRGLDLTVGEQERFAETHSVGTLSEERRRWVEKMEKWLASNPPPEELAKARRQAYESIFSRGSFGGRRADDSMTPLSKVRERAILHGLRKVLTEEEHDHIVMMYGSEHVWALEPRIVEEFGYTLDSTCWHDTLVYEATHARRAEPKPARQEAEKSPN